MSLAAGTRLRPYELGSQIGAGGMGEVYRALDTRLNRSVAIKILPPALAADAELRDRFEREARVISSLNHPNICTLFDVGEAPAGGRVVGFLVLELLDGETVAERLARSGALPISDVLKIAADICSALDRAHRSGIVHRDLKPGNVFLVRASSSSTPPTAKLLDFGLAKGASPVTSTTDFSMPTTPAALTAQGTILGTFQYMAPEQIEGLDADARSDIFALGATLFEMATGRPAFDGKTRAALLGAILKDEPPVSSSLRPGVPEPLDRVIATCLAKDPEDRWQSARDVLHALRLASSAADRPAVPAQTRPGVLRTRWAAATLLAVAVAAGSFALGYRRSGAPGAQAVAFTIPPPPGGSFETPPAGGTGVAPQAAISPDGAHLVFVAATNAGIQLWVRPMSSIEAQPIAGTEDAAFPFWSPDGRSIGFFARNKLRRVSRDGGPVIDICEAPSGRGGTWNSDGIILFGRTTGPLYRVNVAAGVASAATALDEEYAETAHRFLWFLPDGRHFLYTATVGTCCPAAKPARIKIGVLDTRETTMLLEAESATMYTSEHVLFNRDGVLLARPFDATSRTFTGEPLAIADGIAFEGSRYASFSASTTGTLAYSSGSASPKQLTWFDRSGKVLGKVAELAGYFSLALSFDDSTVVSAIAPAGASESRRNIHVIAVEGGERRQVTFDPAPDNTAVWSPDKRQVAFGGTRAGMQILGLVTLATMQEERLLEGKAGAGAFIPSDWSRSGGILYSRPGTKASMDIWTLSLADRTPKEYLATPATETNATFSPDGNWVAYESLEEGTLSVQVRRFPPTSERHVIATDASQPLWSPDGRELFYITQTGDALMSVEVQQLDPFRFGQPQPLLRVRTAPPGGLSRHYAVARDGKRFLIAVREPAAVKPWIVTTNRFSPPR